MNLRYLVLYLSCLLACNSADSDDRKIIPKADEKITIDGQANEKAWEKCNWHPIDQVWLGKLEGESDFKGRYKILWDENQLYVLAEILDDTLIDIHPDPLDRYWDDDCLEIFVDEDNSKGIHQYNHSAFAYHISLDGRVIDMGVDSVPHYYDDHLSSARVTSGTTSIWEVALKLYNKDYQDGSSQEPEVLNKSNQLGFAIAYCDNDRSEERESFIGSERVDGEDKNRGWIDAGIFGDYKLVESD